MLLFSRLIAFQVRPCLLWCAHGECVVRFDEAGTARHDETGKRNGGEGGRKGKDETVSEKEASCVSVRRGSVAHYIDQRPDGARLNKLGLVAFAPREPSSQIRALIRRARREGSSASFAAALAKRPAVDMEALASREA